MYGLVTAPEPRNKNWVQRTDTTGLWYYVSFLNPTPWAADEGFVPTPPKSFEPPPTVVKPDPGVVQLYVTQADPQARRSFLEETGRALVADKNDLTVLEDGTVLDSYNGILHVPDHSRREWKVVAQALVNADQESKLYKVQVYAKVLQAIGLAGLAHYVDKSTMIISGPQYKGEHDPRLVFGSGGSDILGTEIANKIKGHKL